MIIEITAEEAKTIERAIELWEKEPASAGLLPSLFSAMMSGEKHKAEHEKFVAEQNEKADAETAKRKLTAMRIRMKMLEAVANPKEFDAAR